VTINGDAKLTFEEVGWAFVEIFDDLEVNQINEMLIKNIPLERIEFFNEYALRFAETADIGEPACRQLPNLMLLGYLLRVLEERLLPDAENREISS
jgi:hypothetical protein